MPLPKTFPESPYGMVRHSSAPKMAASRSGELVSGAPRHPGPVAERAYQLGMTRSDPPNRRQLLAFACQPGTEVLDVAHKFVEGYLKLRFRPNLAQRVTLAAYELVANALAYGSVAGEVGVEVAETPGTLEVRVSNEAVASRIAVLVERVQRLEADSDAVYLEEIRRSTAGGLRAMLGLARVCHEGGCALSVVKNDRQVVVTATVSK
ncbi:MAG: hypothetical protein JW751_09845 [Polyangiaceae bacterium]|nr:hypothetical protein [Polyangiaceae bacterium]